MVSTELHGVWMWFDGLLNLDLTAVFAHVGQDPDWCEQDARQRCTEQDGFSLNKKQNVEIFQLSDVLLLWFW